MSDRSIDLIGTNPYRAWKLRKFFLSPRGLLLYAVALAPYVFSAWIASSVSVLISGVLLLAVSAIAVRGFIRSLEEPGCCPPQDAPVGNWLSAPLMRVLGPRRRINAGDLLDAAVMAPRGTFLLQEAGIDSASLLESCRAVVSGQIDVATFLHDAAEHAVESGETHVDAPMILLLLFRYVESCTQVLHAADVSREELPAMIRWERFHHHASRQLPWWSAQRIRQSGAIGRSWVMGYADDVDAVATELDTSSVHAMPGAMIRKEKLDAAMQAMDGAGKGNVLVLGNVGSGRKTFALHLAAMLREREREQHKTFSRAVLLQTDVLLSGTANPEQALLRAVRRAENAGPYLLVIRDIASLLLAATPGMRGVIVAALESPTVRVIALAEQHEYHRVIKTDTSLASLFSVFTLENPTDDEVLTVLMAHDVQAEHHGVRAPYRMLVAILSLCKRYLSNKSLPAAAVDVLDQSLALARDRGDSVLSEAHVRDVVSRLSNVNVRAMDGSEKSRLLALESSLSARVIGQEDAVRAVSNALKRARMNVRDQERPAGTFLFLGPTGVGKTQTAKVLAEEYFGSADAMIRLDMNELSTPETVQSLTGASDGSSEGYLTQHVYDHPFSLILLDEIEKAHPLVLNVFLQILDEGTLRDTAGRMTDFRNTIIIATSNAGALFIRDAVAAGRESSAFKKELIEHILQERVFSPEFVNRFDETVVFKPLSHDDAVRVARLMLEEVVDEMKKTRGIEIAVQDDAVSLLLERGYDASFGARELRRTIVTALETYLANELLRRDIRRGETVNVSAEDLLSDDVTKKGA